MKNYYKMVMIFLCSVLSMTAHAQTSHWSVNAYDYQYDMSAYVSLTVNDKAVTDYSNYEIAAFYGDECRGVAQMQTVEKNGQHVTFGYLRIRSNQQEGETITFKVYDKTVQREIAVKDITVTFKSQDITGMPSAPLVLPINFILGDVNNDGEIDIADAVCIVNHVVNKNNPVFVEETADVDNDGEIDIADAVRIVNFIVGKITSLTSN